MTVAFAMAMCGWACWGGWGEVEGVGARGEPNERLTANYKSGAGMPASPAQRAARSKTRYARSLAASLPRDPDSRTSLGAIATESTLQTTGMGDLVLCDQNSPPLCTADETLLEHGVRTSRRTLWPSRTVAREAAGLQPDWRRRARRSRRRPAAPIPCSSSAAREKRGKRGNWPALPPAPRPSSPAKRRRSQNAARGGARYDFQGRFQATPETLILTNCPVQFSNLLFPARRFTQRGRSPAAGPAGLPALRGAPPWAWGRSGPRRVNTARRGDCMGFPLTCRLPGEGAGRPAVVAGRVPSPRPTVRGPVSPLGTSAREN